MGWFLTVEDMHRLYELANDEFPDVPYFLMGHSMGSFLARTFLINYPGELSGCILSGTGQQSLELCNLGILVAKAETLRLGKRGRSLLLNKLCFGKYNIRIKPNRTEYDWLTRDNEVVNTYFADNKCGGIHTNGIVIDMLGGIKYNSKLSNLKKMDFSTPIYFFSGEEDPVGDFGKGVIKAAASFQKAGCVDVTVKLYPDGRHEMLNEINKEEVFSDVLTWIESKMA